MESIVSDLVSRFEKGSLSRRDLVQGLAMLAASGTAAAAAQQEIDFKTANIDHVSIQVADLQRSVDFYQKMFGFTVISEDKPLGIIRLGVNRSLVSLNRQSPAGIVDHFAIGVHYDSFCCTTQRLAIQTHLEIDTNLRDGGEDLALVEIEAEHRLEKLAVANAYPKSES